MRVAVLGSNSFAGSDFVDLLLTADRFEILGISRSAEKPPEFLPYARRRREHLTYRQLDLNADLDSVVGAVDAFDPQYLVNFAAQGDDAASWLYPADFLQTNCVALAALVDRLKGRTGLHRFLQVSSSSVYGNAPHAVTEESPIRPESPYAVSKAAADLLLLTYFRATGFPAQIIRPPNLYGPFQPLHRIIPKSIVSLRRGQPIELHGGGQAVRAYLHVRDASRAILMILERGPAGEIYNVSPDGLCRIRDLVALVCQVTGHDFEASTRDVGDRRAQTSVTDFDSTKIRRELGWNPQIPLRRGVEEIYAWIDRDWSDLMEYPTVYTHAR